MAELRVKSEIAGAVWQIEVAVGDRVAEEDALDKGTLRTALNKLGLDPNKLDPQKA